MLRYLTTEDTEGSENTKKFYSNLGISESIPENPVILSFAY